MSLTSILLNGEFMVAFFFKYVFLCDHLVPRPSCFWGRPGHFSGSLPLERVHWLFLLEKFSVLDNLTSFACVSWCVGSDVTTI